MSDSKIIARQYVEEAWGLGHLGILDELLGANSIYHDGFSTQASGLPQHKQAIATFYAAFPDLQVAIDEQIADGDKVVTRWTAKGTHQGEFLGISPTNKEITITGVHINRITNDKIVETWNEIDSKGLIQQLSVIEHLRGAGSVPQEVARVTDILIAKVKTPIEAESQGELALLIGALTEIEKKDQPQLIGPAEIAISSLYSNPPNIELARTTRLWMQRVLGTGGSSDMRRAIVRAIRRSAPLAVACGLGVFFYIVLLSLPIIAIVTNIDIKQLLGVSAGWLSLIAIAGGLGSMVSILIRVHKFTYGSSKDPLAIFLFAFFKPVVGASFGLFIFAILNSGFIPALPSSTPSGKAGLAYLAFAFIAGFSERFVPDIVGTAEDSIGRPRATTTRE